MTDLTPIQAYVLGRSRSGPWALQGDRFDQMPRGGRTLDALRRRRLIDLSGETVSLTPDGAQALVSLPALDALVAGIDLYMLAMWRAKRADDWITGQGEYMTLYVMGYLEHRTAVAGMAIYHEFRLSEQGRALLAGLRRKALTPHGLPRYRYDRPAKARAWRKVSRGIR